MNVLVKGLVSQDLYCDVVCSIRRGDISEVWLRCSDVSLLLSCFGKLASIGVVLACGGVDGRVYRPFPTRIGDLTSWGSYSFVFSPGSSILIWHCSGCQVRAAEMVLPYSREVYLSKKSRVVRVVLSKPLSVEYFFDNGIRILKPITTPPILLKTVKKRQ